MTIRDFDNYTSCLNAILSPDEEWVILRHALTAGENIRLHYHPQADEYVILAEGFATLALGEEEKTLTLSGRGARITAVHFPAGQKHLLRAHSALSYVVLRSKADDTIYVD